MSKKQLKMVGIGVLILIAIILIYRYMFRRDRLVELAKKEVAFWGGRKETDTSVHPRLIEMWQKGAGWNWVTAENIHKVDNEYPWSAAGICYLVRKIYSDFPQSASHAAYVLWAKKRREEGRLSMIALDPKEYKPKPGDIIIKTRGSKLDLSTLRSDAKTHGDIVISNNGSSVQAIGFNLSNTAKPVSYNAPGGYVDNGEHFAVINMGSI